MIPQHHMKTGLILTFWKGINPGISPFLTVLDVNSCSVMVGLGLVSGGVGNILRLMLRMCETLRNTPFLRVIPILFGKRNKAEHTEKGRT